MLLQPKNIRYKKQRKRKLFKINYRSNKLQYGIFGLKALKSGVVTAKQIESARQAINRRLKKSGKIWIRIYPHIPITAKPLESRMGKGRGSISHWACKVSAGSILFELDGIPINLAKSALTSQENGFRRVIIEKPFGYDLESGRKLNKTLHELVAEEQIFRIDHYLGKETVQNLLVTRFANGMFEPLWNRNYIHRIEITSAESIGVEERGGYYDSSGALRDMVQNHLLQIVGLTAMEPPSSLDPDAIRNEVLKVFQSLQPIKEEDVPKQVIRSTYKNVSINRKY